MKVCFPVSESNGTDSKVYGHFGSAKSFIVVDSEDLSVIELGNDNEHHEEGTKGACNPLKAFKGITIDALVAGGLGGGALMKLKDAGIRVFQAKASTVKENLELLVRSELPEFALSNACAGHQNGCAH